MERFKLSLLTSLLFFFGCAQQYEKTRFNDLTYTYWRNPSITKLTTAQLNIELSKDRGQCTVKSRQVPIPSPSCVQPPKQDCSDLTGFSKGFCESFVPPKDCNYSSVNEAKRAQDDVFMGCMSSYGWNQTTESASGEDISGGIFEKIAISTNNDYYIKPSSLEKINNEFYITVRSVNKESQYNTKQLLYIISEKENTVSVDGGTPVKIEASSPAFFILKRLKQF